jgi:hypothetical protein
MIPGVGPYSALITPKAGSLFHAVFQAWAERCPHTGNVRKMHLDEFLTFA